MSSNIKVDYRVLLKKYIAHIRNTSILIPGSEFTSEELRALGKLRDEVISDEDYYS